MISKRHLKRLKKKEIVKFEEMFALVEADCEKKGDNEVQDSDSENDYMEMEVEIGEEGKNVDFVTNPIELNLNKKLKQWYLKHTPIRDCVLDLVKILKQENLNVLPFYKFVCNEKPGKSSITGGRHAGLTQHLKKSDTCPPSSQNCQCAATIKNLERSVEEMKNTLQQENKVLRGQLQIISEALADQKVTLNRLLLNQPHEMPAKLKFPLQNEEDISKMNSEINDSNKDVFAKTIKSLLQPAGVLKNLKSIISDDVAKDFNVGGVQGKKSLKHFGNFYNALLEGVSMTDGQGSPDEQLRKAIQLQKKRIFKSVRAAQVKNGGN